MGLRLPGGIEDPETLWDYLVNKRDARSRIPKDRFDSDGYYSAEQPKSGTIKMQHGYFLSGDDIQQFDAASFSMTRREVERTDPQQRLLLEVVREALEAKVGLFSLLTGTPSLTRNESFTVKTGCSSSMIAVHLACEALRQRQCDGAVVGGTNLILTPSMSIAMSDTGIISKEGRSRTFDANSDGYGRGEAINAVYLKRLDDAVRDGNPIRAVIRNTGINACGRSASLTSPSSKAQEALIRDTYASCGLDSELSGTPFVECHGTGTSVGDPLEVMAIARALGEKGTFIGSIKPNIGHSEGASGLTGLIKAVLALEKKTIPPNINFKTPNPRIPWKEANLIVPLEATPWPKNRPHRVSVNCFGAGGANSHAILESASSYIGHSVSNGVAKHSSAHILVFSANQPESLDAMVRNYRGYVDSHPNSTADLAYTLARRREHLRHRVYVVVDSPQILEDVPIMKGKAGSVPSITYVFTGQGAQWPEMGKSLTETFPIVSETIQQLDSFLATLKCPPQWTIRAELLRDPASSRIHEPEFSQPLCTALQIALVNLWAELGIAPDSVVGHSSGEIGAAYVSGAVSAGEAIIAAYFRGQAAKSQKRQGAMAAVGMGAEEVRPFLVDGVVVACENSSGSVTISGDKEAVDAVVQTIAREQPDTFFRHMKVLQAYHSHHMKDYGESYQNTISPLLDAQPARIPFFSTVYGANIEGRGYLDAEYWRLNLESPVRFETGVRALLDEMGGENRIFLEIGPHGALAGPLRQIFRDTGVSPAYVPTISRGQYSTASILDAVGKLFRHSAPVDFGAVCPQGRVLTDLPHYPWHHKERFWHEGRTAREWRQRRAFPHEILGSPSLEWNDTRPAWRNVLELSDVSWLRDHRVGNEIVFPAAAYVAMAGEAVRQLSGDADYSLRGVMFENPLVLEEECSVEIMTILQKSEDGWYDFAVSCLAGTSWTKHCWGQVKAGRINSLPDSVTVLPLARPVDAARWYRTMQKLGSSRSGPFKALKEISADPCSNTAAASVYAEVSGMDERYSMHPAIIDQVFQMFGVASIRGQPRLCDDISIPTSIDEMYIGKARGELNVQATSAPNGDAVAVSRSGDILLFLRGAAFSVAEKTKDLEPEPPAAVQVDWKRDITFMDPGSLMKPAEGRRELVILLEKLFFLSAAEVVETLAGIKATRDHLQKLYEWLCDYVQEARDGQNKVLGDMLPKPEEIEATYRRLCETEARACAIAISRNRAAFKGLFEGTAEPLDILMEDGVLTSLYGFLDSWDYSALLQHLGHKKPLLRVLEIGGTTHAILRGLRSDFDERLYSQYTFTDVSSGFFHAARERFADAAGLDFAVLDIARDPTAQGFAAGAYDLVIAANVLHATPALAATLRNVRTLLAPGGALLLQELATAAKWINFVVGTLPGWWLGAADGRPTEPYVAPERWDAELRAAGFSGADVVAYDDALPYCTNANMIATARGVDSSAQPESGRVALLHDGEVSARAKGVATAFERAGYTVTWCGLADALPEGHGVVSLLELERPFLDEVSAAEFGDLMRFVSALEGKAGGALWVTRGSQIRCRDPRYARILGLARTVRYELNAELATVEVGSGRDEENYEALVQVFKEFQGRDKSGPVDPDFEYAIADGQVHVGRMHWISVKQQLSRKPRLVLRADASYVMAGGLGGLGQSVARWMAENGARHFVFISRSGRTISNDCFLRELEIMGCSTQIFTGPVESAEVVRTAIKQATKPVAGVLQMAMVMKSGPTRDMTFDDWQAVMGPRVTGTWNLHDALSEKPLDFFVLFSSSSGLVGQWGHADYAASNTFLDHFVQYRHSLGLPASALDLGPVEDVGYVARSAGVANQFHSINATLLGEQQVLDALELAIIRSAPPSKDTDSPLAASTNPSTFGVGFRSLKPLSDPSNRLNWKRDARLAIYRNLEKQDSATTADVDDAQTLKVFLASVTANNAVLSDSGAARLLAREIGKTLCGYLLRSTEEIVLDQPLNMMGIDSLVSIELRNWCRQQLGFDSPVPEIMKSYVSLFHLLNIATDRMQYT
ncbi:Type I Iterative PKS [Neofusicoccum ribis]|uniref:Type I Iterative PKS n=1 Tax=Neofusicoccum ribis TaxID=45134 RepID=A0ABR3SFS6_9PEZI